jgi:hypothetical protein
MTLGGLSKDMILTVLKKIRESNMDNTNILTEYLSQIMYLSFGYKSGSISNTPLSPTNVINSLYMKIDKSNDIDFYTRKNRIKGTNPLPFVYSEYAENGDIEYLFKIPTPDTFAIIIRVKESEQSKLERYLFPAPEGSLKALLEGDKELTAEQIAEIREDYIEKLPEEQQGDAYMLLQAVAPYHSQRDNLAKPTEHDCKSVKDKNGDIIKASDGSDSTVCSKPQEIADRMCNLTSVAMAFEFLGISKDDVINMVEKEITLPEETKNADMEDILDYFRNEKDLGNRTQYVTWDSIAKRLDLSSGSVNINSSKKDKQKISEIKEHLQQGRAAVVSFFLVKGHIVRVQDIDDTGITVDDPYGEINNMAKRDMPEIDADSRKNDYDRNSGRNKKSVIKGNNNSLSWDEIDIAIESGRGGNVEHEDTEKFREKFDPALKTNHISDSDYVIETREVEEADPDNKEKTVKKEKKYIKWYGGTVKIYKIYYKE